MKAEIIVTGDEKLRAVLSEYGGVNTAKAVAAAWKKAAGPMLSTTKHGTPVVTGRLRASMGLKTFKDGLRGEVGVILGPRRDFTYTIGGIGGTKFGARSSAKRQQSFMAASTKAEKKYSITRQLDEVNPNRYAYFIEYGVQPSTGKKRRAGPAHMMLNAFKAKKDDTLNSMVAAVRQHLERAKT